MPHLSIEYSAGIEPKTDVAALCAILRDAIVETGLFPLAGIRVRAHRVDYAVVADAHPTNEFLAMTLSVGAGRTTEQLRGAGEDIFKAAETALADYLDAPHFALSLEIRVSDPELSWKHTPIHERLSKSQS